MIEYKRIWRKKKKERSHPLRKIRNYLEEKTWKI